MQPLVGLFERHARRIVRQSALKTVEAHVTPFHRGPNRPKQAEQPLRPAQCSDAKLDQPRGRSLENVPVEGPFAGRLREPSQPEPVKQAVLRPCSRHSSPRLVPRRTTPQSAVGTEDSS